MALVRLVTLLLALAALAAPSLAASDIDLGRYHAIVIGNNDYANLSKLRSAVNDARHVADLLERDYDFAVHLLVNATRSDVIRALSKLRANLTPNDNLLIYYAGHGVLDSYAEEGYWLPVDAEQDNPANWISNANLTNLLRAIRAKHVMVVADSCYSGTLVRAAPIKIRTATAPDAWIRRMAEKRSRTALVSGGLEPVIDSGGGANSVFAKAFLSALRKNNGIMDGQTVFAAIKRPVALESDQTPQYSDIRRSGHDGGDFLFQRISGRGIAPAAAKQHQVRQVPQVPAVPREALDITFWNSIKDSDDPAAFEAYLVQFPDGTFAAIAKLKIRDLGGAAAKDRKEKEAKARDDAAAQAKSRAEAQARQKVEADQMAALARARSEAEEQLWKSVAVRDEAAGYETYLNLYPAGRFAALARQRSEQAQARAADAKQHREQEREAERQRLRIEKEQAESDARAAKESAELARAEAPAPRARKWPHWRPIVSAPSPRSSSRNPHLNGSHSPCRSDPLTCSELGRTTVNRSSLRESSSLGPNPSPFRMARWTSRGGGSTGSR
ncbi:MAG: hypothetical protein CMM08_19650 [Rhodospirillaceae bacterium]|jgi:uncharacterized caspase-like protein|nr:hypothetical protein [Rhodospirillaceae bacterium]